MGVEAIIATLVGVAGVVGAYFGGRKTGRSQDLTDTETAMNILRSAISQLQDQIASKDVLIADLHGRVQTLESMVTQKADVEAVANEVKQIRIIVDKIAYKVDAS